MAERKLFGLSVSEESAVKQVNSIYLNLNSRCVKYGWWKSGLQKFQHLRTNEELEITDEQISNELNERLETKLILSEN